MSVGRIVSGGLAALLSAHALAGPALPKNFPPSLFHKLQLPLPLERKIQELEFHPLEYYGNSELQPLFEGMLGILPKDELLAFFAYDILGKRTLVTISENKPMRAASMLKSFLILAYFHRLQEGTAPQPYDGDMHSLMVKMVKRSKENKEANILMAMLGGPKKVTELLTTNYGHIFRHTSIVQYIPPSGRDYENRASASDFGRYAFALHESTLPYAHRILEILGVEKENRERVAAGIGKFPLTKVYNKTGTTAHACGDFAYIRTQDASGTETRHIAVGILEKEARATDAWMTQCAEKIRFFSKTLSHYLSTHKAF